MPMYNPERPARNRLRVGRCSPSRSLNRPVPPRKTVTRSRGVLSIEACRRLGAKESHLARVPRKAKQLYAEVQFVAHFAKNCRFVSYLSLDRRISMWQMTENFYCLWPSICSLQDPRTIHGYTMRSYSPIRLFTVLVALICSAANNHAQNVAVTESNGLQPSNTARTATAPNGDLQTDRATSQFTLGPADVIRVNVWKNTDLSQTVTVGPDGFVSLPLLGDVHVAGMTANQLAQSLSSRLTSYVVSAQVTVSVVEIRSRQVYVTGQVGKPGGYSLVAPITVLQLIAQAGGLNTFANRKGIIVLRGSNGNMQRLNFNYVAAIHGDNKQNITLQPGDTVVVP
jgi:polysaccharide export outer membrane protein